MSSSDEQSHQDCLTGLLKRITQCNRRAYEFISTKFEGIYNSISNVCASIGPSLTAAYCAIRRSSFGERCSKIYNAACASRIGEVLRIAYPCMRTSCIALCSWVPVTDLMHALYLLCFEQSREREALVQDITERESTIQSLMEEKKRLQSLFDHSYEYFEELQSEWSQNHPVETKGIHKQTMAVFLKAFQDHLTDLLTLNTQTSGVDQKEQYRVYGLVKSACIDRHASPGSSEEVKEKVRGTYPFIVQNEKSIDENITKSLSMTWSMLTLIPPLLVITTDRYDEEHHDTNRATWDEDNGGPLYYYRPIAVYGNRLHVAVKGLVGNAGIKLIDIDN